MSQADILIDNGIAVTMDPGRRILSESSVAVAGGKIVGIGPAHEMRLKYRRDKAVIETDVVEWAQQQAEHTVELYGLEPLPEPSARYWRFSNDY